MPRGSAVAKSISTRASKRAGRAQTRPLRAPKDEPSPDVYQELLSEAATSVDEESRPIKKRKTAVTRNASKPTTNQPVEESEALQKQTAYDDSPTSEESDVEWQDITLQEDQTTDEEPSAADKAATKDISVVIGETRATPKKSRISNRLPSSAVEKKKRIDTHKLHVSCLLAHAYVRNSWCNDADVQSLLKPLLNKRLQSYLTPNPEFSQFQRTRSFLDGLQQACDIFKPQFHIISRGLRRPQWVNDPDKLRTLNANAESEKALDRKAFINLAKKRAGSRDVGAQLFCAMLRLAGVDARLVCSLQPLSFASPPPVHTPQSNKRTIIAKNTDNESNIDTGDESAGSVASLPLSTMGDSDSSVLPRRIKRFGVSANREQPLDMGRTPPTPAKRRKIVESHFPVYWIEAFNTAHQKWIPVDPLVTQTIDKPHKFEPPASDSLNDMSYVVAFNEDGTAKDVTRRYAKAYNAKTRRMRADSTKDGQRWWKRILRIFKGQREDRDQVEDAELAKKEAAEPMPRNVQDFKDHPYYALERHLRHNEVIEPKREVGKLSTGKTVDAVESIYRRRDVQIVRMADKWYRMSGREVKPGEQPLKYGAKRRGRRQRSPSADSDAAEEDQGIGLYAEFQTDIYVPPPVVQGRIPKNAFGNLDIYVSSMIPPGAVHVRAVEAAKAAVILGIDFADAVTGFEFRGRHGTAVVKGAVVAREYAEAIEEVVKGLRWQKELEEQKKKSVEALRLWKRFMVGLRVRERVMSYEIGGAKDADVQAEMNEMEDQEEKMVEDGGFLPDQDQVIAQPTARAREDDGSNIQAIDFAETSAIPEPVLPQPDYDDFHMLVYSPWDAPGPLSNHPKAPVRSQMPAEKPKSSSFDVGIKTDIKRGANHTRESKRVVEEEGGGGFFVPDDEEDNMATEEFTQMRQTHGTRLIETRDGEVDDLVNDDGDMAGGGFIADDDDNGGGGFLIEPEEEEGAHSIPAAIPPPPPPQETKEEHPQTVDTTDTAGSGAVAQNVDEAPAALESARGDVVEKEEVVRGGKVALSPAAEDAESLMSEDPDDEDAEPEWLQ